MTKRAEPSTTSENPTPRQDWGSIISAGIVALVALVVAVNLVVFDIPPEVLEKLPLPPLWVQAMRWAGVLGSVGGGGFLTWRLLQQR